MLEVGYSRKFCVIGHNTSILVHHLVLAHILPKLQKIPWGDGPQFGTVLQRIYPRLNIWYSFVDMLSRFEVMHFQLMAVLEKWAFSLDKFFGGRGEKELKVGEQPWPHPNFVRIFHGDPLRDGRDPLSRMPGPKRINKKGTAAEYIADSQATRVGRLNKQAVNT